MIFINWKHILTDRGVGIHARCWWDYERVQLCGKQLAVPSKSLTSIIEPQKMYLCPNASQHKICKNQKLAVSQKSINGWQKNENAADMHKGALCSRTKGWRLQTRIPVWRSLKVVIGEAQKMAQPVNPSLITGRREPCPESCPLSLHTCCGAYPLPTKIIIINIHFHNAEWKKTDTRVIYC